MQLDSGQAAFVIDAEADMLTGVQALKLVGFAVTVNDGKHHAIVKAGLFEQGRQRLAGFDIKLFPVHRWLGVNNCGHFAGGRQFGSLGCGFCGSFGRLRLFDGLFDGNRVTQCGTLFKVDGVRHAPGFNIGAGAHERSGGNNHGGGCSQSNMCLGKFFQHVAHPF